MNTLYSSAFNILQIQYHSKVLNAAAREIILNHMCKYVTLRFSTEMLPFYSAKKPEPLDGRRGDRLCSHQCPCANTSLVVSQPS